MAFASMQLNRVETANFLCVILAIAKEKLKDKFRFRNYQLQDILSSSSEARELFIFSNSGSHPFSPELEEALSGLSICGFLNRYDIQDPCKVVIRPVWLSYADRVAQGISKRDLFTAKKIADHIVSNLRPAG